MSRKRQRPVAGASAQSGTASGDDKPFIVLCQRRDGRDREFQRYSSEAEANAIAARLSAVGCPSKVRRIVERKAG